LVSCARATRGLTYTSTLALTFRWDVRSVKDGLANDRCYTFIWLQYCPVENKCTSLKDNGSSPFHGFLFKGDYESSRDKKWLPYKSIGFD